MFQMKCIGQLWIKNLSQIFSMIYTQSKHPNNGNVTTLLFLIDTSQLNPRKAEFSLATINSTRATKMQSLYEIAICRKIQSRQYQQAEKLNQIIIYFKNYKRSDKLIECKTDDASYQFLFSTKMYKFYQWARNHKSKLEAQILSRTAE
uniref:Uncharacterized protein n=1 Tax=Nelumbo nucifera TaxID=4432 RepID=A0A822Z770_NELNU|nr:TPA_asm: hypothetical protein HUJ06_014783 [Nelumbo nucifera]